MSRSLPLLDFCEESTTITCDSCAQSENLLMDSMVAIDEFFKLGWRVKKGKCLCPSCAGGVKMPCDTANKLKTFEKDLRK